jgi:hypothetical protein
VARQAEKKTMKHRVALRAPCCTYEEATAISSYSLVTLSLPDVTDERR